MTRTQLEVTTGREEKDIERISHQCTRWLTHHRRDYFWLRQSLAQLAEYADGDLKADNYGRGDLISDFEADIAQLLGKEAAVFMPSGTMCQQIALRVWSDRRHTPHVAFHPKCHLEIHEHKGYQLLHGLHGVLVGSPNRLLTLKDVEHIREPLAALLIELPQREIGGQLPAWGELTAIVDWARERGIATHLDGARLWECKPFYRREYAEVAALFDTVYVSFYKILGGIAGAILAGPADVIAESRIWQRRHGGNLVRLYPYVLSARKGLEERLSRMNAYHDKAVEVAEVLRAFPQIDLVPDPPHTNMMHLYLRGDKDRLETAALEIAQETRVWMFSALQPGPLPAQSLFELTVGDATLDLSRQEIAELFQALFQRASK